MWIDLVNIVIYRNIKNYSPIQVFDRIIEETQTPPLPRKKNMGLTCQNMNFVRLVFQGYYWPQRAKR